MLAIKSGKQYLTDGIEQLNKDKIRMLWEKETYKYMGILEADTIKQEFGCPRGVMVKAMHCGIVVREFVLQSRYYVHFRANTLGKGMNPLILPPAMGK